jgi:hypothetical protein
LVITLPANTHPLGTLYVTNQTDVLFFYDPKQNTTNALCLPVW